MCNSYICCHYICTHDVCMWYRTMQQSHNTPWGKRTTSAAAAGYKHQQHTTSIATSHAAPQPPSCTTAPLFQCTTNKPCPTNNPCLSHKQPPVQKNNPQYRKTTPSPEKQPPVQKNNPAPPSCVHHKSLFLIIMPHLLFIHPTPTCCSTMPPAPCTPQPPHPHHTIPTRGRRGRRTCTPIPTPHKHGCELMC